MSCQRVTLSLFQQYVRQSFVKFIREHKIAQSGLGVRDVQQRPKLTLRLSERNHGGDAGALARSLTEVVDEVAKLLGELRLPGACGFGCDLHGHRVELRVVPVGVALYECLELIVGRHQGTSSQWHASKAGW